MRRLFSKGVPSDTVTPGTGIDEDHRRKLEQRLAIEEAYALGRFSGAEYYRRLKEL